VAPPLAAAAHQDAQVAAHRRRAAAARRRGTHLRHTVRSRGDEHRLRRHSRRLSTGRPGARASLGPAPRTHGAHRRPRLAHGGRRSRGGGSRRRPPDPRLRGARPRHAPRRTAARRRCDRAGLRPRVVSGGSTPTLWQTHEIAGVTEFRPGTYVYNDRTTAAIGACGWDECALTVLATVVSTAVPGQAVIDAGTKALGREPMRGVDPGEGFGCLLDRPDVVVKSMSEEHGILDLSSTSWRPEVGERVRVIPNHVCSVVHLNDTIAGVRGDMVETSWPVAARGRGYRLET